MKLKYTGLQRGKLFARSRIHNIVFKGLNKGFLIKNFILTDQFYYIFQKIVFEKLRSLKR